MDKDVNYIPITSNVTGVTYLFYYDRSDTKSLEMFEGKNKDAYIQKLQDITDNLGREQIENPLQVVNNSVFIYAGERPNAAIILRIGDNPDDPFSNSYPADLEKRILKINTGMLEEYSSSQIAGVLEHELGHVINERIPSMSDSHKIGSAFFGSARFSAYFDKTQEQLDVEFEQNQHAIITSIDEAFTSRDREDELNRVYMNDSAEFISFLQDKGKDETAQQVYDSINEGDGKLPENLRDDFKEYIISTAISDRIVLHEVDINNKDFQNYMSQIRITLSATTRLFDYVEKNYPEEAKNMSPHQFAEYLIETGKVDRSSELVRLYNEFASATYDLAYEPYGNRITKKPYIEEDGTVNPYLVQLIMSPYALPNNGQYTLPENMSQSDKHEYLQLFSEFGAYKEKYFNSDELFESFRHYNESIADVNINTNVAGAIEAYRHSLDNPPTDVDRALSWLINGDPVHPGDKDRYEYLVDKAERLSSTTTEKLNEFLDRKSDGKSTITQRELDEIVKIAGDLVEVNNVKGGTDEIIINNGTSKTTYNITFENDDVNIRK